MSKIVLILGSGPRVGEATSAHFAQAGYKVALVSRSIEAFASQDKIHIKADLSDPTAIGAVFQRVQEQWGAPSVVIYNPGGHVPVPDGPWSAPVAAVTQTVNLVVVSAYAAAQAAVKLNPSVVFLYTGNALNDIHIPGFTILGMSKRASAYWLEDAAQAHSSAKFYFVDQRNSSGGPALRDVNGPAHAKIFLELAEQIEQGKTVQVFRA